MRIVGVVALVVGLASLLGACANYCDPCPAPCAPRPCATPCPPPPPPCPPPPCNPCSPCNEPNPCAPPPCDPCGPGDFKCPNANSGAVGVMLQQMLSLASPAVHPGADWQQFRQWLETVALVQVHNCKVYDCATWQAKVTECLQMMQALNTQPEAPLPQMCSELNHPEPVNR